MKEYSGYRLYVNVGASQARRRLKGRGLGVKKVETAGTGQAVVIHTATGEHRRRLEQLFSDVLAAPPEHPFAGDEPSPAP